MRDLKEVDARLMARLTSGELLFEPPQGNIEQADIIPATFASTEEAIPYIRLGRNLLKSSKVAALVVAGGQGSRLGIDAPKGVVGVTPVKNKSLFQLFAEKILALQHKLDCVIPWFIMTSRENDNETRDYFRQNGCFGLGQGNVHFFVQGMLPSVTKDGKFIIDLDGGLFMNPDGHGGTFKALHKSGSLELMRDLGIEEIFYFQVDNPLVKVCDPLFLGLHHQNKAQMSSKVVRKVNYEEKVGVMVKMNNKTIVMEYSDMDDAARYATSPDGEMLHWGGNSAIHVIRRDFVEKITKNTSALPFHRACKKVIAQGKDGRRVEIEGIKFETFLFDALPFAKKTITLEVLRDEEFAPVKNQTGVDSLETSTMMQSALHASWLEKAGLKVREGIRVEISPLFALDGEDLKLRASELPHLIDCDTYLG